MAPTPNYTVKISFNEELRRLPYSPEKGVQGLFELCQQCFNLKSFAAFQLTYQDGEGDTIVLTCNEELATLFKDTDTIKLTLQRRGVKKAVASSTSSAPFTSETAEASGEESEPKKDKEGKKKRKEKRRNIKSKIVSSKVVRLRWKELNVVATTSSDNGEEKKKKNGGKRRQAKGCYFGSSIKGKLTFKTGLGKRSLWLAHTVKDGEGDATALMFAPLSSPKRFLRVCPDGTVNLSNGGIGKRTRWSLEEEDGKTKIVSKFDPKLSLAAVSAGKKKNNRGGEETKLRQKLVARGIDGTGPVPANVVSRTFVVEDVDATQLLVKVVKSWSKKRRTVNKIHKQRKEEWKSELKGRKGRKGGKGAKGGKGGKCRRHQQEEQQEGEQKPHPHHVMRFGIRKGLVV